MYLKRAVRNLIRALNLDQRMAGLSGLEIIDFLIQVREQSVAIEVRDKLISARELWLLAHDVAVRSTSIDVFMIITSEAPAPGLKKVFCEDIRNSKASNGSPQFNGIDFLWLTPEEFMDWLGLDRGFDFHDFALMEGLRSAAIAVSVINHLPEQVQADFPWVPKPGNIDDVDFDTVFKGSRDYLALLPQRIFSIRRHLSDKMFAELVTTLQPGDHRDFSKSLKRMDETLSIGSVHDDVIVVMTDIVNSSALTTASDPLYLVEVMYEYYRKARELAWHFGGYVDKFTGDGLAVLFNYPDYDYQAPANAVRYAKHVIDLGTSIYALLKLDMNEDIATGTRIGMASGSLRVMDVGLADLNITFVGDAYNRVARLEKNCPIDGVLMDNRTKTRLNECDGELCESLHLEEMIVEVAKAKGQRGDLKCWSTSTDRLSRLKTDIS